MINRISVEAPKSPNFVGCWKFDDVSICDHLIAFYENKRELHKPGISGDGTLKEEVKKSTDILVSPKQLETEEYGVVADYMERVSECFVDYLEQWEFLKKILPRVHIEPFNIQKYDTGGHFNAVHSERVALDCLHRMLVWMTYLNDVEGGGETEFPMYGLRVKPEAGKTLIWPAEWTHAHRGCAVTKGEKYIITGWMHFPDDS